jgi:uncharacterized protein YgiM (DUF1202 family)
MRNNKLKFLLIILTLFLFNQSGLVKAASKKRIAQIKIAGSEYVRMRKNSNTDSEIVQWVPQGEFVTILSDPVEGTIGQVPGDWYRVTYQDKSGFIAANLLNVYVATSSGMESDIAQVVSAASDYINMRENSNTDSMVIDCVPKGEFLTILSGAIDGSVEDKPGKWYKVEYNNRSGYIWSNLLSIYMPYSPKPPSEDQPSDSSPPSWSFFDLPEKGKNKMDCKELEYIIDRDGNPKDTLSDVLAAMQDGGTKGNVLFIQDFFNTFFKENDFDLRMVFSPDSFKDINTGNLLLLDISGKNRNKDLCLACSKNEVRIVELTSEDEEYTKKYPNKYLPRIVKFFRL